MNRFLAPILLLVFLFPALALGETMDDLVVRDGIHYKKFTAVPFTGKVTGNTQGKFKNGKKDGPWVRFHDNGQLFQQGTFKDGYREGRWVEYDNYGTIVTSVRPLILLEFCGDGSKLCETGTGTFKNGEKISD